jgi:hypothetical protein
MVLHLLPEEPQAGPWRAEQVTGVAAGVMLLGPAKGADHRLVDRLAALAVRLG